MINRKEKGSRRERQAKKELEAQGYLVTKAGGSLGAFDIIAIPRGLQPYIKLNDVRLIQVKSNSISKEEKNQLRQLLIPRNVIIQKEIWIYKDRKGKTIETI